MKNWKNQTIWTKDNLHVLRGMNSGSVDLIYLDPPFNSNRGFIVAIGIEGRIKVNEIDAARVQATQYLQVVPRPDGLVFPVSHQGRKRAQLLVAISARGSR